MVRTTPESCVLKFHVLFLRRSFISALNSPLPTPMFGQVGDDGNYSMWCEASNILKWWVVTAEWNHWLGGWAAAVLPRLSCPSQNTNRIRLAQRLQNVTTDKPPVECKSLFTITSYILLTFFFCALSLQKWWQLGCLRMHTPTSVSDLGGKPYSLEWLLSLCSPILFAGFLYTYKKRNHLGGFCFCASFRSLWFALWAAPFFWLPVSLLYAW